MKRTKKLGILLGVLLVLCIATVATLSYEKHQEVIKNSGETILEVQEDSVSALSWKNETTELSFHNEDGWTYDDDENFPVDEDKINEFLGEFSDFAAAFVIEDVEDYGQYGLENPVCTIQFTSDNTDYEITLGDYSKMDSQRYVSIGDGNVYLVQKDPLDDFSAELRDMVGHDKIPDFSDTQGMEVTGNPNGTLYYQEDNKDTYCADDVYFTTIEDEEYPLDTERVNSYLKDLSQLDLTDYVTYYATEDDVNSYGLDKPDFTVNVDYTYIDENEKEISDTFVFHVACDKEQSELEAMLEKEESASEDTTDDVQAVGDEIVAYARVGESQIIYQLSLDEYEKVVAMTYNDLRHQEVITADFSEINQIDVSIDNQEYTFTTKGNKKDRTYYFGEDEIDAKDLENALVALKADDFTNDKVDGKEEISLTLHFDNDNYKDMTIVFNQYDGTYCLATINGISDSLVKRDLVVDVIESINAIVLD